MKISPVIAKKKDVEEGLAKDGQVDVIQFSLDHNVAAVAIGIRGLISTASNCIKKKFLSLYQYRSL